MFINEVAKKCNTTKKSIQYYIEQGLISPSILENGYREFSDNDVEKLKEIVLYRKLGLSISEIKNLYENSSTLKSVLYRRTLDLEEEKLKQEILKELIDGKNIKSLEQKIEDINSKEIIIKKLINLFPSYYGKFISLNFSKYLTGKIETKEQFEAFKEIIDFFDNVPDFEIPKDLQDYLDQYLEEYSSEQGIEKIKSIISTKDEGVKNIDEFVKKNKDIIDRYNEYKQTDEFKNSPANRLMILIKKICSENGYYDKFIPAMRKLSPLYNEYYEQLLSANEQFLEKYPEYLEK